MSRRSPGIRGLLGHARRWPERALHPLRRRLARARMARLRDPPVLFVCLGNICRSPFAEGIYRSLASGDPAGEDRIASAGFIRPGRPSPSTAQDAASSRGVDLSAHRSRVLSDGSEDRYDLFVVMEPGQVRRLRRERPELGGEILVLGDLDPEPVPRRAIPDPFDRPREVFEECYDRIERCLAELHALVRSEGDRSGTTAGESVPPGAARDEPS